MEMTALVENPEHASVRHIVEEAMAAAGSGSSAARAPAGQSRIMSPWISPAPITVKLRLFCLPYAGGISENVYARWPHEPALPPGQTIKLPIIWDSGHPLCERCGKHHEDILWLGYAATAVCPSSAVASGKRR